MSLVGPRRESPILNAVFASGLFLSLFLPLVRPPLQIPEFAPPKVIYSRDLVPLLLAPWAIPSTTLRVLSRLLQSVLVFRLPKDALFQCYHLWIAIALSRTLVGFLFSRAVGWAYPRLFSHWALYESSGGCGPSLVAYLIVFGVRPDHVVPLSRFRGCRWEANASLVLLVVCVLLACLDNAPWTYGTALGLAILAVTLRAAIAAYRGTTYPHPSLDPHAPSPPTRFRTAIQLPLLLLVLIPLPNILSAFLTSPPTFHMPPPPKDGAPLLEIILLSYPRPNDTPSSPDQPSILSHTIASYLPFISPSTTLSVFTHASPDVHPAFTHAQHHFEDAPITFHADRDAHPDAYPSQYLHLAEAFRWVLERDTTSTPEWIMLVEDDFPICGEWGWNGVVGVVRTLEQGARTPSPEMLGGFVGTGGSGLILHRTLLPILSHTLRLHALTNPPSFMTHRPPDIIIQDCLLGIDPLCPSAPSSEVIAEGKWRKPTMVITSRLVMDHIGGVASTAMWRVYDTNKWKCGWRHPFHGRSQVTVVPV